MAKKKDVGNVLSLELPVDAPVKEKRVISDKQRDNLKKGMAALKAKREGLRKEQEEESAAPQQKQQPVPVQQQQQQPQPQQQQQPQQPAEVKSKRTYKPKKESVGLEEFNTFKNELLGKLQPKEIIKEVSVEKIVDRPIVTEKVVEREKYISSSELLNRIFFS
jgi:hypothetical protein